jgi:hypothetical protein
MAYKFRIVLQILLYAGAVIYPGLVFYFLVIRKTPIRMLSLFVIAFALFIFITSTSKKKVNSLLRAKKDRARSLGPLLSF